MAEASAKNVLVTGGAGYIGSHIVLALKDQGHSPVVIDNLSTGFRWMVPQGTTFYKGDIGDRALIDDILKQENIQTIVHAAASVNVQESIKNPDTYYKNNTENTQILVDAARMAGVRNFIFSSTASVYAANHLGPIPEDAEMDPISPYGHSKLLAEGVLHDAHEPNRFNFCVLRYFNAAGADPAGRAGQSTEKATHLMKVCVEAAVGKRPVIPVYGTDYPTADGTCMRDYVHVSDLADAHVAALEALVARPSESWVLNCGYGHGFSVLQVLDKMDEVANMKIRRRIEPRRPGDPASLIADNSRITATLDWTPRYADLSQIIAHSLAWERLHTAKLATQV